jgi:TonB-dependent SusC/RagA subfamily outer membrane receptor
LTDANGYFEIEANKTTDVLVFSFIGFRNQEIAVSDASNPLIVKLEEANVNLDEVIVIGYGVSTKKLLTGSVENINAEELKETASYSLEGALSGKASGIQILQNSGTPGSAIAVKIRGTASIYSGTQPLYVIDGVPMTTGNYSQIGYGGQGIDASMDINPNNIESITVLKDASASAIYGARAANGVILITTKKGKSGKSTISFRSYYGFQKEWKRLYLMDAMERVRFYFQPQFCKFFRKSEHQYRLAGRSFYRSSYAQQ